MSKIYVFGILSIALIATSCIPSFAKGSFKANHPRRAQVLGRNAKTNTRLNGDKGDLGGHYSQLKGENHSIHQQERQDAKSNGGHISKGEQQQLNKEHNQLNSQIRKDHN